ncbi:hypothetical protein [Ruegeria sp. HKCCA0370]|uniref:hypothetical protein n=1 Tax=Ruegeria sp. HKCCA0370 TaxID=2682995 RepID=UPI0014890467|nr:hypothetical protein [Ruegeria sp. HKCCA0370]
MPGRDEIIVTLFDEIEGANRDATSEYLIEAVAAVGDVDPGVVEDVVCGSTA